MIAESPGHFIVNEELETRVDVMLAVGDTGDAPDGLIPQARHFNTSVDLTEAVSIGPLPGGLADAVLDAREARDLHCHPGYRQYGSLYALTRRDAPRGDTRHQCDPDFELSRVAAVLRVVRPHAMSLGDAARIISQPDGRQQICPSKVRGPGSAAYVMDPSDRWIRDEDVETCRALLQSEALRNRTLPKRISWAMVAHELLHWQHNVEVRWQLLCTALEGLVHTNEQDQAPAMQSREQFVVRLARLSEHVTGLSWTETELDRIYDHRNETMHRGDIRHLWTTGPFPELYRKAEAGFRSIIQQTILRPSLAEIFKTETSVRVALGSLGRA